MRADEVIDGVAYTFRAINPLHPEGFVHKWDFETGDFLGTIDSPDQIGGHWR